MKKVFLILLLMVSGLLFAETKTFHTGEWVSFIKLTPWDQPKSYSITGIYPCQDSYILEITQILDKSGPIVYKFYVDKNLQFDQLYADTWARTLTVTDVGPNTITFDIQLKKSE